MASIGASYYEDTATANDLFFTARYSLMNYAIRYRNLSLPASGEGGLLNEWQAWIEYESIVRTNYAIYVFLCTLSVNFEVPNALLDSDMKDCHLPCNEDIWLSPTPQTWLAVRQYDSNPPIRFSDAMRELNSPQTQPTVAFTAFGGYVTFHALVKQLGNLNQGPVWLAIVAPTLLNSLELALEKWRMSFEKDFEYPFFPRYPQGVLVINSISLYRQAHVRLCGDFGPLRSAMATRDVQEIVRGMNSINVPITRTKTCLKAARCAIDALRTPIRLTLHNFSTPEEQESVKLTLETRGELNLAPVHAQKPFATQLVYAWALIFERCNATKVQGILAEALNIYASTL
ncbi:uncharacterized protein TRUGW13939_08854 [Talaromyces rugulosus]|uniref:Uncharacterized protein n=1 Tax=Talaromyces rugulosus TaxID=121627 RepID=A0A7H8R5N5_TALRU|nr:uncharacterized protein TRUGW13939_08854 [Talaromyces rugulosus]QKX61699.1 hypothetical protein TRUGW13939_08854 [Talaromyces rugulosus]